LSQKTDIDVIGFQRPERDPDSLGATAARPRKCTAAREENCAAAIEQALPSRIFETARGD